jgi:hypothetical protein
MEVVRASEVAGTSEMVRHMRSIMPVVMQMMRSPVELVVMS